MEINVLDHKRIVEIWLTNEEQQDTALKESLKPLYAKYKQQKYLVAVFQSGKADLLENTTSLLIHNRTACLKNEPEIIEQVVEDESEEDQGVSMMM